MSFGQTEIIIGLIVASSIVVLNLLRSWKLWREIFKEDAKDDIDQQ